MKKKFRKYLENIEEHTISIIKVFVFIIKAESFRRILNGVIRICKKILEKYWQILGYL